MSSEMEAMDKAKEAAEEAKERKHLAPVSLTIAILAVFVAIVSLLGHRAHTEEILMQTRATDQWSYYQAKSIKSAVLRSKMELVEAVGKTPADADRGKLDEYEHDLDKLKTQAEESAAASEAHLAAHEVLQRGVTLFHIAIAVVAIAVLTKLRPFWYLSIAAGVAGIFFLVCGLLGR